MFFILFVTSSPLSYHSVIHTINIYYSCLVFSCLTLNLSEDSLEIFDTQALRLKKWIFIQMHFKGIYSSSVLSSKKEVKKTDVKV